MYKGPERRKYPRVDATFVVSYRIKEVPDSYDLVQTRNISQGGMLITTNQYFEKGTQLALTIRFPFVSQKILATGEVVACKEVVKNLLYETRLKLLDLDMEVFQKIGEYVSKVLEEYKKRG